MRALRRRPSAGGESACAFVEGGPEVLR